MFIVANTMDIVAKVQATTPARVTLVEYEFLEHRAPRLHLSRSCQFNSTAFQLYKPKLQLYKWGRY